MRGCFSNYHRARWPSWAVGGRRADGDPKRPPGLEREVRADQFGRFFDWQYGGQDQAIYQRIPRQMSASQALLTVADNPRSCGTGT